MARPKQPFFSLQAHGTIGRVLTHRRDKRRTVAGIIPTHPDPATDLQEIHRARFQEANLWWNGLSDAEKEVYRRAKYPPRMTGHQRAVRQWMIDNPYPPPPPPWGFDDDFDDNLIDPTLWSLLQVGTGTVAEANQQLECTCPAPADLSGVCSLVSYDSQPCTCAVLMNNQAARYTFLMCSLTKNLLADPAGDNDWYRFYLQRNPNWLYVDRKVGGAYLNVHNQPWAGPLQTLTITIALPNIEFREAGVLVYSEAYALGPTQLFWYIHAQATVGDVGMNWYDDFTLRR